MMKWLIILLPMLLASAPFYSRQESDDISASVVKIFSMSVAADYLHPWQMKGQRSSTGSGVLIGGRLILTAAHVVSDGVFIQVKKSSDPEKYIAHIKWISHEADLALLEVEDTSFFEGMKALRLGNLPHRQDGVAVYGYPEGGNEISITQGIVSRVEQTSYVHSGFDLLALQIDAAINPGNSGGPALNDKGEIVGIAMQTMSRSDNIGYIVPSQIIRHFLDDIKDNRYDGFPDDGLYIQYISNKNLKKYYHIGNRTGVLVTDVVSGSSCSRYVRTGDILLEIDGVRIANDGTITMEGGGSVSSNYLLRKHQIGDLYRMKVLRGGKELDLKFPLKSEVLLLPYEHGKRPRYYIFGGMVFMPLTQNYLRSWGKQWIYKAPINFLELYINENFPTKERQEVVFLHNTLPDKENNGYIFPYHIVKKVNGKKITSFTGFVKSIEESSGNEIRIDFEGGHIAIINKEKASEANQRILPRYNIEKSFYLRKGTPASTNPIKSNSI